MAAVTASSSAASVNPGQEKRRYDRRDGIIYNDRVEVDAHVGVILTQLARTSVILHVRPSDLPAFCKYYFSTLGRAFGASRAPADLEQAFREKELDLNRMFSSHVQQQRAGAPDVMLTDDDINTMRTTCTAFARELIRYQLEFKDVWTFCEGYWKSLSDNKLEYFLNSEAKKAMARFKNKPVLRPPAGGAAGSAAVIKRSSTATGITELQQPESALPSRTGTPTPANAASPGLPPGDSRAVTPAPPGTPHRGGSPVPGSNATPAGTETRPPTSSGRPGHTRGSSMEVERGSLRKLSMDNLPNSNTGGVPQASAPSTPPGSGQRTPAPIAEANEPVDGNGTGSYKAAKGASPAPASPMASMASPAGSNKGSFDPSPIGSPPSGAQAGGLPPVRGKRGGIGARAVQQPSSSSRNNSGVMSAAAIAAAAGPSPRARAVSPQPPAAGLPPSAGDAEGDVSASIRPTSSGARAVTPLPPTAEGEERSVASPTEAAVTASRVADVDVSSAAPPAAAEVEVEVAAEPAAPAAAAEENNGDAAAAAGNGGEEGAAPGEQ